MEKASSRLKVFAALVLLMFAALTTRLWFLQVLASDQFREQAAANIVRIVKSDALRGDIKTADKVTLVDNVLSLEVRVDKQELEASGQGEAVLLRLSRLLKVKVATIRQRLDDPRYFPYQPKPVAEFVPKEVFWFIREHPEQYPGVQVLQTSVRGYPHGRLAAHAVGYLGLIDASQDGTPAFANYGQSDMVGKAGLEEVYEKYLRGTEGEQKFIVNSNGDTIRALGAIPPAAGDNLILTMNSAIQTDAETELKNGILAARGQVDAAGGQGKLLKADAGAVVVMDVKTGGVVAMASWPNYDPSWFVKGITPEQNQYLFHSHEAPSVNRATQLTYKPGSTFKPLVALAALKEGVASLGGSYDCPALYTAPNDTSGAVFTNWSPTDIGFMSIAHSLTISCDTVYYQFGYDFWNGWRQRAFGTNNEPLQRDLRQWGFGSGTGVDLPGEQAGVIPDNQFAVDHPSTYPFGWVPGGDILLSIGSGDTLVTPLQLASAYSAIANGGQVCRPHLVDRIQDANNHLVKTINDGCKQLPYSQTELQYIRDALTTVPQSGTAATAFRGFPFSQYPIAGKTGTAERAPFQSTSWFASFAPSNAPKYAVVVMVEEGGFGSQTAAPIARHLYEDIFGLPSTSVVNGGGGLMDLVAGRYASDERRPIRHLDPMLLLVTGLILVAGLLLVYSATATTLVGEGESPLARVEKQVVTAVIGVVLMLLVATFDYRFMKVYAGFIYAGMIVVLILVRVPGIGSTAIGDTTAAQRWFQVGSFQLTPSEFVKVGLIIMLAAVLSELRSPVPSLRDVIRVCAIAAVPLGLVFLQPDIGTSIVLICVAAGMLVVAGTRPRHLLALSLAVVVMLFLAFQLHVIKNYQLERLTGFLDPTHNTLTTNYNRQQAEIAVGSGGIFGRGWGNGTQTNLDYVPEQHTDFIFSVAGEEFGFVGSTLLLGLYGVLLWRAIRIAYLSKDPFGTYLAAGVASMFAIQMFVNVGMVIGIMPITGIPLPFVSYGGSQMLANFLAVGILLNVHMRRFK